MTEPAVERCFVVPREARGERVERWLAKLLPNVNASRAAQLLAAGQVRIGGTVVKPGRKLWGGEEVVVSVETAPARGRAPSPLIPVLFEDASIVIVNKPPGMVVERSGTLASVVASLAGRSDLSVGGRKEPGVVHRLDRETSGCLVLAKTDEAVDALKRGFDEKRIQKTYVALVLGKPPDTLSLDTPYARHPDDPRLFTTKVPSPRRARLSLKTTQRFVDAALVEIALDTGRTHQIRVQLSEAGFPVLGDAIYGPKAAREAPAALALGRHALHAARLRVDAITVEAPLPTDLLRAIDLLKTPVS